MVAITAMPDYLPPGICRAAAVVKLRGWLTGTLGAVPIAAGRLPEAFSEGWELATTVEGATVRLRVLIDTRFPWSKPRVALVDPPPSPSYPHVEKDGLICVFAEVDEADPRNPVGTAKAVLAGAEDVLVKGMTGANIEDFRTEFQSYWVPGAKGVVRSIIDPCEPTRIIKVWDGKKILLAAEDAKGLRNWLCNCADKKSVADISIMNGLLVWLPQPMLPAEYPVKPDDVLALAASVGAADQLMTLLRNATGSPLVLFGARSVNGTCFAGVRLVWSDKFVAKRAMKALVMKNVATLNSVFKAVPLAVERADPWWVHGRDSNPDITDLIGCRVPIIGSGSLGSPMARLLAQAGTGQLDLIDPEALQFANVARHALGADSVGSPKAERMAHFLGRHFPHARFSGYDKRWQDVREVLDEADLIVAAVGSWGEEGELNQLHIAGGLPPILYTWLEPHGVAAHAILLGPGSGCLQCGLGIHGEPGARVVDFAEQTLRQTPACGAFFQPYGPTATAVAAGNAADLALDFLLDRAVPGEHRVVSARAPMIQRANGSWSFAWTRRCGEGREGGRTESFDWLPSPSCPACGGKGLT